MHSARKERPRQQPNKHTVPQANVYTFKVGLPATCDTASHETLPAHATTLEQASPEIILSDARQAGESPRIGDRTDLLPSPDLSTLPEYITPLREDLDQDVLQLLQRRAALTVPSKEVVHELLRGFVLYVYPLLPLLDLGSFLDAVAGINRTTISLVLFQAVMFASVMFTDLAHLQHEGFPNHKVARKVFFDRVKLLYEMDVETNPMTMIQVLLLMTYWYGRQNDAKGRFYWIRTALSLATDMGLDRQHQFSDQPDRQRTRRKLWCCCLIRDKLLSITERRQDAHIDHHSALQIPQPDDFDNRALAQALNKYYIPGSGFEAVTMGRLCAQKIKLCLIIGRILDSQYELNGLRRVDSIDTLMVLIPKIRATNTEAAARDQELHEWYAETSSLREAALGQDHRQNGRVLGVHSATLEMLYLTALCAVHRPQLLHEQHKDSAAGALQAFSRQTLRSAARRISEIGRHLEEGYLVQFLPPLAVGAFIAAAIQHLKDALSTDAELHDTGRLYLNQTLQAFATLKTMYNSADCAIGFVERVRSGQLPYQSFEWEDRANPETPQGESVSVGTYAQPIDSTIAQTSIGSTSPPLVTQKATLRLQRRTGQGVTDISHSTFDNEEYNMLYSRVPDLESFAEVLLSAPFNASDVDWASMDWSHV